MKTIPTMKPHGVLAAMAVLVLTVSLLLAGCLAARPDGAVLAPTDPQETAPAREPEGTPLTQEELDWFRNTFFFGPETALEPDGRAPFAQALANHFLVQDFDDPARVNLRLLFYDGSGAGDAPSREELDALEALGAPMFTDATRLVPEEMDRWLRVYTGLGLEEMASPLEVMDGDLYYLDATGCYYLMKGDTLLIFCPEFESGLRLENGDILLRYSLPVAQDAHQQRTLTLRPAGDSYQFVSNAP